MHQFKMCPWFFFPFGNISPIPLQIKSLPYPYLKPRGTIILIHSNGVGANTVPSGLCLRSIAHDPAAVRYKLLLGGMLPSSCDIPLLLKKKIRITLFTEQAAGFRILLHENCWGELNEWMKKQVNRTLVMS